jgi:PAS domain S-box-containing protein
MNSIPFPLSALSQEERFEVLVAGIRDYAIYLLDPGGYISSWNAGAERFKGYTADEVIGTHFSRFYTDEERADDKPGVALMRARSEGRFESEGWRVRKDGGRFWASVVIDAIHDRSGRFVGFAKITRDISEQKRVRDELNASEQRFRMLVQGVTDYAIYMLSPQGAVTNWNAGAERIKGFAASEVVGTDFSRFYTDEDRANGLPQRALATAAQTGKFEAEGWRVRRDGSRFWAHVVIDAIRDESGELIGFAKITRDVTERRKAAESLEQARTALFQSQKMQAIGQLTGGVAHDFNNLLAILSSGLDVMKVQMQQQRGTFDMRVFESMRRAVERGATLTQQLLSFARQQPLAARRHNINRLVRGFEAVLRRATASNINLTFSLADDLRLVMVDEARFEAALLNLVVNARDALPSGGEIELVTRNVELAQNVVGALPEGLYVEVSVCDNGVGMTKEQAERAFEPFFTTKPVGKGTGLGLSQVHGFMGQSGGEVRVESELGRGTSVRLYLPALEADARGDERSPAAAVEKVLIVEDEQDLLEMASELFRNMGYEVMTASNGADALAILQRHPQIEVLFADVMMPGMSGLELARVTRRLYPPTRILLASGYPAPVLRAEQGDIDEFALVTKPYRLSEIARRLR